ncbi:MAG: LamG domain-containing protein [Runella zeae]
MNPEILKNRTMKNKIVLILMLSLFFSCKKKAENLQPSSNINKTHDNVRLVDNTNINNSPLSVSENSLEFSASSSFAQNIKINDVLVSDKTSKAEFGFLRKITSVSNSNGKIIVTTQQASLSDVFEEANISFEQTFIQTDLKNGRISGNQAVPINIDVDYIVKDLDKNYDTENDQLAIKGSLKFEPTFKFNWKREKGLLPEQVDLQLKIKDYSELKLNLGLGFSGEIPIVPPKILGTSTIIVPTPIGPVPIIFTHVITFKGKFEVGTSFETGAKIISSGEYALGIRDNFEPFSDIKPKVSFTKPDYPERSAEIKVGIFNPVFESRPYGIDAMKLYLEADAGIKLNVNLDKSPNWTVKRYALGKVGFKPNLSFFLKSISTDINYTTPDLFENEQPFDQGDFKIKVNPIPTNGLIAYYPFNGNANDESGNKNNGTATNVILTTDRKGINNRAYLFDGKTSYIDLGKNINPQSFTISSWIKTAPISGNTTAIVSKIQNVPNSYFYNMEFRLQSDQINCHIPNGDSWTSITSSQKVIKDTWVHIVVSYDKATSEAILYINGVKDKVGSYKYASLNNTSTFIGARPLNLVGSKQAIDLFFNGSLDDIRVYNRAITNSEVQTLFKE